jgi:hypothetical protein
MWGARFLLAGLFAEALSNARDATAAGCGRQHDENSMLPEAAAGISEA